MRLLGLCLVIGGCWATPRAPVDPPAPSPVPPSSIPAAALISFDGPFATEAALCEREAAALYAADNYLDGVPHCVTGRPSFELSHADGRPSSFREGGRDHIVDQSPFRAVHVLPLAPPHWNSDESSHSPSGCLLVIATRRGWFATDRIVTHCDFELQSSPFQSVGQFQVRDVFGDPTPELVIEVGEQHERPCGDCSLASSLFSSVCGVDRAGVPRCTLPMQTMKSDEDGRKERRWSLIRPNLLEVGGFSRIDDDARSANPPRPTLMRWQVEFDD